MSKKVVKSKKLVRKPTKKVSKKVTAKKPATKKTKKLSKKDIKASNRALLEKRLLTRMKKKGITISPPSTPLRDAPSASAVGGEVQQDLTQLKEEMVVSDVETNPAAPIEVPPAPTKVVTKPDNQFPIWPDAKCGHCGHDASQDPNGDCYLYKLDCPNCGREGCDECMPGGRGCPCPECEESPEAVD